MSENYKPGDVVMNCGNRVFRTKDGWHFVDGPGLKDFDYTVRPLVVLDPEDAGDITRLAAAISKAGSWVETADIREALRNLVSPPKPKEPTGLGAVVEDEDGFIWVRLCADVWACSNVDNKTATTWETIPVARVLSEGVSA